MGVSSSLEHEQMRLLDFKEKAVRSSGSGSTSWSE